MRRYFNTGGRQTTIRRPKPSRRRSYALTDLDPGFWRQVQAKCKAQGISVRAKILSLLQAFLAE